MAIFFRSHEIIIRRNRLVGTSSGVQRYNLSATYTAFQADIQPLGIERSNLVGGRIGSTFTAFLDASVVIKEGDQITSGGYTYSVKGVSTYQGAGLLDHHELILTRENADN